MSDGKAAGQAPARAQASARRGARRASLSARLVLVAYALVAVSMVATVQVYAWLGDGTLTALLVLGALLPVTALAILHPMSPVLAMFRALAGTVTSYRDGDFAFSLAWPRNDELGELVAAHNALGDTLRQQREALVHRELLLDTMVQHSPVAMLLFDPGDRVVFGNLAARKLLHDGRRLEGLDRATILAACPDALREAVARGGDGLFSLGDVEAPGEEVDTFYLARTEFRLNGRPHELFVLRHLTHELRREEVRTWKKVIRVISHELNNSLAPIASLAHSGAELVKRGDHQQLDKVFTTIAERAHHLERFILGYARFAKLPAPRLEEVLWPALIERMRSQLSFQVDGALPEQAVRVDPAQLEQALVNLLRNAHESGSPADQVQLAVRRSPCAVTLEIRDRGAGLSEAALANALLPFYSTKRGGTGLGLALVREIAEAHGGRVAIANRPGGGVSVTLSLPQ
jgi:two-component system, NtrC family, nitrogen regulation sensor histidine kinase NtrY